MIPFVCSILFIGIQLSFPERVSSGYCLTPFDLAADGNCYWLRKNALVPSSHENMCLETLTAVAVIKSPEQITALANLIVSKIQTTPAYNVSYWLGINCTDGVYTNVYGENATFLPWNPGHTPQCNRCIQLTKGAFTTIVSASCTTTAGAICQLLPPNNEPGLTECPLPVPGFAAFWQNGNRCNYFGDNGLSPVVGRYMCQTMLGGDLCTPVLLTDFNDVKQHFTSEYGSYLYVGLRTNHTTAMALNSYNWLDGSPFLTQNSSGLTQWQGNQSNSVSCVATGTTGMQIHACTCANIAIHSFCCRVLLVPGNHTYRVYRRVAMIGADLANATNTSLSDCKQLCDSDVVCRAVEYTDTGICYLKKNNSFQGELQPSASADFYEQIDAALAQWEFKGCFEDQQSLRDLPYVYNMSSSATAASCVQRCLDSGYGFAGLQAGQLCMCGKSYGKYGSKPNSECAIRCPARSTQYCGGSLRNAVFATSALTLRARLVTKNGYRLVNHVLRTVPSQDLFVCARTCTVDAACRSFNFSPSNGQCELNDVSHLEAAVNELTSAASGWLYGSDNTCN